MGIGETFEVLGTGLEEGALGIQHFEETELPELEALGGRVVGAASAGQNLLLERLNVREQRLQPLLVLGCIGAQAQFRSTQFVPRLVGPSERLEQVALVAIKDRKRDRQSDDGLIASQILRPSLAVPPCSAP